MAKYYENIQLGHLAKMLILSEHETEQNISNLVSNGTIFAKMDRPAKIVCFQKPERPEELLTSWSSDTAKLLSLVETTCRLINKENMTHKIE